MKPVAPEKVVYRCNSSGEHVRQSALQIGPHGCECAKCHTVLVTRPLRLVEPIVR